MGNPDIFPETIFENYPTLIFTAYYSIFASGKEIENFLMPGSYICWSAEWYHICVLVEESYKPDHLTLTQIFLKEVCEISVKIMYFKF